MTVDTFICRKSTKSHMELTPSNFRRVTGEIKGEWSQALALSTKKGVKKKKKANRAKC